MESSLLARVKVYNLVSVGMEDQWIDKGTGYASIIEDPVPSILVKSEVDEDRLLLSAIEKEIEFEKQEGTLILWEDSDGRNLAISFQEKMRCDSFFDKICSFKETKEGKIQSSDEEDSNNKSSSSVEDLSEVTSLLLAGGRIDNIRSFFPILLALYLRCEMPEDAVQLQNVYFLVKRLIHSDRREYFDVMLNPQNIDHVIDILNLHCERQVSQFKQIENIEDKALSETLEIVFKTLYIRDISYNPQSVLERETICLGLTSFLSDRVEDALRLFEDSSFLSSFFSSIVSDPTRTDLMVFVRQLVRLTEVISSWQHYCQVLLDAGLIKAMHAVLKCGGSERIAVNILLHLIDKCPNVIRDCLQDSNDIIEVLVHIIINDSDSELKTSYEILTATRQILDSETISDDPKQPSQQFVDVHFHICVPRLIQPLFDVTDHTRLISDKHKTARYLELILDHLSLQVPNHANQLHPLNIDMELLVRVVALFSSSHKLLVLSAVRYFKEIMLYKPSYAQFVCSRGLIDHLIPLLSTCGRRYNMINSAVLEFFENCCENDSTELAVHIISEYYDSVLCSISYVKTFTKMKMKTDMIGKESLSFDDSCDFDGPKEESLPPDESFNVLEFEKASDAIIRLEKEKLNEEDNFVTLRKSSPIVILMPSSIGNGEESMKRGLVDYDSDSDDEDHVNLPKRKCID